MRFESLRLINFRNYRDLRLEIPPGVVVFLGQNGQGKTNLVEAFHFLLHGESFRPSSIDSLLTNQGPSVLPAGSIHGRLEQSGLSYDLKVAFQDGKKAVTKNNQRVLASELIRQFPLILFSPESLSAIKEGPEQRRRLVDDLLLSHRAGNFQTLRAFRKALKTRNRILRDTKAGRTSRPEALRLLESLDPSYLPLATELTMARLQALNDLQEDFEKAVKAVLEMENVDISVEYIISDRKVENWSRSDVLSAMHKRTLELRERELDSGATLVGPQRHDIRLLFAGKDSRFFCSQGQQRALILSFKMAQILYHYKAHQIYPFLLLDDVLSELDPIRRTNLVKFLKDIPAQIFLTTTDLSFSMDFGDRRLNVFQIEKGTVSTR